MRRSRDVRTAMLRASEVSTVPDLLPKVQYAELLPHEFGERLGERPVGYLPLGTLEWHGPQSPLGADFIQASAILERAAVRHGGIVLPHIWLGPDDAGTDKSGRTFVGMDDSAKPPRQLSGSLYWVAEGLFLLMAEAILAQAERAGVRCIVAEDHGRSRDAWGREARRWRHQYRLHVVSAADLPGKWATQTDHAGHNETSIRMAVAPTSSISRVCRSLWRREAVGIRGHDPRDSTPELSDEQV